MPYIEANAVNISNREAGITTTAANLLNKLLGAACQELGGLLEDSLKAWRAKLLEERLADAAQKLQERNVEPQTVSPKILIPLINSASLEEEPSLQALWTNLLTSAASGKEIHPQFSTILSKLTASEAKLLNSLDELEIASFTLESIFNNSELNLGFSEDSLNFALSNLIGLNLCEKKQKVLERKNSLAQYSDGFQLREIIDDGSLLDSPYEIQDSYILTAMARNFLSTVRIDSPPY